ncbi:MAG: hypothetical protein IPG10_02245 [Flavobacteriales bacterium]|nr:hypothetical protein [Flavobacteriales bacterium]
MATQEDKERKLPPAAPPSIGNTAKETDTKPDEGKDPDLYDPVGMAGKKAGIVQELEQQLEQEGTDARKGIPAASHGTGDAPAPQGPKNEGA